MKELKLEIGKRAKLNNQYSYELNILHIEEGYYIVVDKQKLGPYFKVLFEKDARHNNDMFITGYNLDKSIVYRVGLYGLEVVDTIDTSLEASKMLNKMFKQEIKIDGCALLGVENGYSIFVDESDSKFFMVNNGEGIKSVDEYQKFDTYMQLVKYYRAKGIRVYDDLIERYSKDSTFMDFEGLVQIIKGLRFEDFSAEMQGYIENGYPFNKFMLDYSGSEFLIDKLKDAGKLSKIKKIHLKNNENYEKELNEEGFYCIGVLNNVATLMYFAKRHSEKYQELLNIFENRYYEILSTIQINENALELVRQFSKSSVASSVLKLEKADNDSLTVDMFEEILKGMYDNAKIYSYPWSRNALSARWLKCVSHDIHNELWKRCEEVFIVNKKWTSGEFDDTEEFIKMLRW